MKRILIIAALLITSSAYGNEAEIAALKHRVAKLEQLVSYLLQQNRQISNNTKYVTPEPRTQYIVTLYDQSTFLIYKWDRRSKTTRDRRGNKIVTRQYIMQDVFGSKREWSCDKVRSIVPVRRHNVR